MCTKAFYDAHAQRETFGAPTEALNAAFSKLEGYARPLSADPDTGT